MYVYKLFNKSQEKYSTVKYNNGEVEDAWWPDEESVKQRIYALVNHMGQNEEDFEVHKFKRTDKFVEVV